MAKKSEKPVNRRLEIIQISEELFYKQGYNETSVNDVIEKIGIAKGTFYHYFKSKEEVLKAIVQKTLDELIEQAELIINDKNIDAKNKMKKIFFESNKKDGEEIKITKSLHQVENRALHEEINIQIVIRFTPIIEKIVKQGKKEKVFKINNAFEKIQFLVTASQFLFDEGLFNWNEREFKKRRKAMQEIFEKVLGAKKGDLEFISKDNN
jgi:AcrR family transcriptional regulator